jgi:hypothetical protein
MSNGCHKSGGLKREFEEALTAAAARSDTRPLDQVLTRWRQVAASRSVHLSEAEHDHINRARAGDFTDLLDQTGDGTFRRLE